MQMTIDNDEHVFICGQTGTGKSVVAEVYLAGKEHVVKLDTKGEVYERRKKRLPLWHNLEEGKDFTVVHRLEEVSEVETPKIIYCPVAEELEPEYYDSLMRWVYKRENTILWIDELMEVAPSAQNYPKDLKALYTRGRSKESVVWACTQRPTDIPVIAMANSAHYFIFTMQNPDDRKKIVKATGMPQFHEQPGGHNFWYWKVGMQSPVLAKLKL
ncbi:MULTISPECIES: ATP-binding protein [Bacillus subtilis group]|uniref:ATP-binding protein n=1 Tax=Bacillus subtilis group TaxID=653685 RepID=UPI0022813AC8|nr:MULTISPECIES: ATP-binding protein [Bacillus subtilis group]MCY8467191.1 ATP-binding protein [Bacillus atrophaeus]MCY8475375.1 ATP-binding protein [Bacillus halotolerans]MCY8479743.1 ATP-binding protein [Bacillus atrophaeus]MCY8915044.1 ATP-binding protein [Bacillus atrophaeus]MEC0927859.1 ATP-binding protein [Bacillus atrophaeus]